MKTDKPKSKKDVGLGRGLESLLEDNTPEIKGRPQVVHRGDAQDIAEARKTSDDLYRKEGAVSYVKTPKRSRS